MTSDVNTSVTVNIYFMCLFLEILLVKKCRNLSEGRRGIFPYYREYLLHAFKTVSNGLHLGAQDYGTSATTGASVSG